MVRPPGVCANAGGISVAVHAPGADLVEFCIDTPDGEHRHALQRHGTSHIADLPALEVGTRYGFRAHGTAHDPDKLLLDPHTRSVTGSFRWHPSLWPGGGDSAPHVARSVYVEPVAVVDTRPRIPWSDTVIYETHVRGISRLHPDLPPRLRGTYAGLASEPIIDHLTGLGVTTVELLPIARFVHEAKVLHRGLRQYWGYMPIAPLAPHDAYAADRRPLGVVTEVAAMVEGLHAAGLEVIVDVVLNHTGEGPADGPWISLRGLDDRGYHRHGPDGYDDVTGTGNTLDFGYQPTVELAIATLRHWALAYGVDGFRFDLAATLRRTEGGIESGFLAAVAADPVVSGLKLIAEPWDAGPDGYRLGDFPAPWREWNDRFRDTVRSAWCPGPTDLAGFATRLAGSFDRFGPRTPSASVNQVTTHDGVTLADLVTYEDKHNLANGEDNRDGPRHRHGWNTGVEGPSDDPEVVDLRNRRRRSLLATVLLARGTPLISGGDELGRTQLGNDNAYCQDTTISWYDWSHPDTALLDFTRRVIALRRSMPVADAWLDTGDTHWLDATGSPIDWRVPGDVLQLVIDTSLIVCNTGEHDRHVTLPPGRWRVRLDTASADGRHAVVETGGVAVPAFTLRLLEEV